MLNKTLAERGKQRNNEKRKWPVESKMSQFGRKGRLLFELVTAIRYQYLTQGDENVSRYGIKEAFVRGRGIDPPRDGTASAFASRKNSSRKTLQVAIATSGSLSFLISNRTEKKIILHQQDKSFTCRFFFNFIGALFYQFYITLSISTFPQKFLFHSNYI